MEQQDSVLAGAVVAVTIAAILIFLWTRARRLRNALEGQEGHRLMVIFCNLFLIDAAVMVNAASRSVLAVFWGTQTMELRVLMSIIAWVMFVGIHAWVLLSIRDLINSGRTDPVE